MNSPVVLYPAHLNVRVKPKNLKEEDTCLFRDAFEIQLPMVHGYQFLRTSIIKNTIFQLSRFRFYTSLTCIQQSSKPRIYKTLLRFLLPYRKVNTAVWITDEWSSEYFHWLTDALPRFIAVSKMTDEPLILLPEAYRQKSYIRETIELLKLQAHYFKPGRRLFVKTLLVAEHTAPTGNYNKKLINELREWWLKGNTAIPGKKIYVSRAKAGKRKVLNEAAVIEQVTRYGYEVHYFEAYSLDEQVHLLASTRCLIGLHGAGLTNMLFMKAGGQVLEIRNEDDTHNNCFFSLASDLGHDYYYIAGKGTVKDTNLADFTVDTSRLAEVIELIEKESVV